MSSQLVLRPGQSTGVAIAFGVLGFAMMPLLPVSFESAVECTYPVNEETSSGMLMLAGMRACGREHRVVSSFQREKHTRGPTKF